MDEPANDEQAPSLFLPQTAFYSVEYPGYVNSLPNALATLPQTGLDNAFRRTATALELHLRPNDPFAHPLHGDVIKTSNLVLRVVKRKRKDGRGEYTADVVGNIGKTARFRAMADYQFAPDPEHPIVHLRHAMDRMDVDAIKAFRVTHDKDRKKDGVTVDPQLAGPSASTHSELIGPPLWARTPVPLIYGYKPNAVSIPQTVTDANGEERVRLVNRSRWKGYAPASVDFADSQTPEKPLQMVEEARKTTNGALVRKVAAIFEERPVWTRQAVYNQVTAAEEREINNSKVILPLCAWIFSDGPWRDTFIRFGYDPRKNKDARLYQRLYFRNSANEGHTKKSVVAMKKKFKPGADAVESGEGRDTQSHIFDGVKLRTDTAIFQLCDIHDPLLKRLIMDPAAVRDECDARDGWYKANALLRIKAILRRKFFGMLEGRVVTDEDCADLLDENLTAPAAVVNPGRRVRPNKNNMAKGALRPEDAAAERLRSALQGRAQGGDSDEYVDD